MGRHSRPATGRNRICQQKRGPGSRLKYLFRWGGYRVGEAPVLGMTGVVEARAQLLHSY